MRLNPPAATTIEAGDQLILIAEDDSTIKLGTGGSPDQAAFSTSAAVISGQGAHAFISFGSNRRLATHRGRTWTNTSPRVRSS